MTMQPTPILAWNDPSEVFPAVPRAGLRWGNRIGNAAPTWKPGPWDWSDVHLVCSIDGRGTPCTLIEFAQAVKTLRVFDIVNLFDQKQWWSAIENPGGVLPEPLCEAGRIRTRALFRELYNGLSPTILPFQRDYIGILTDHEGGDQVERAYVTTLLLREAGFTPRGSTVWANYGHSHGDSYPKMVGSLGAMDGRSIFFNAYDRPELDAAGFDAWLNGLRLSTPLVVALSNTHRDLEHQARSLAAWRQRGGALKYILRWNHMGPAIDRSVDAMIAAVAGGNG